MEILICIYVCWGIYSGFKVLSGRIAWLDKKKPLNLIVKLILSFLLGIVIGAFYLIYLIFKILFSFWKNW